jgi:Flp pilus assembly protein TadD
MRFLPVLLVLVLAACASAPASREPTSLFHDERFAPPAAPVSAAEVFALTPAMRDFLRAEISTAVRVRNSRMALIEALNRPGQLKLDYDTARTRNAGETFAERKGNCLSLVVMTAALAREFGIDVRFQMVFGEETWSRQGDTYLSVGHVNLTLGRTRFETDTERITVDFVPVAQVRSMRRHVIFESTVVAMYMNNRAVESFTEGRLDDAYWFAREAVRQDPHFLAAVNTLGVVYRLHGDAKEAEAAFAEVLAQEPGNTIAMTNMVPLLREMGRTGEADRLARTLAELEPYPAFHFYRLGIAAVRDGDFETAKAMFTREVERAAYYHEFHYWLAVALFQLGETNEARRHLAIAIDTSTTRNDRDLYAAKLARISSSRIH